MKKAFDFVMRGTNNKTKFINTDFGTKMPPKKINKIWSVLLDNQDFK